MYLKNHNYTNVNIIEIYFAPFFFNKKGETKSSEQRVILTIAASIFNCHESSREIGYYGPYNLQDTVHLKNKNNINY